VETASRKLIQSFGKALCRKKIGEIAGKWKFGSSSKEIASSLEGEALSSKDKFGLPSKISNSPVKDIGAMVCSSWITY
jgi:hypothetical protein